MKISLLRSRDLVTGSEVFRIPSLLLYGTLTLQVVMTAYSRHVMLSDVSVVALSLLTLLFFTALGRYVWPNALRFGPGRLLAELVIAVLVIAMLSLQGSMLALPLPWLIGVAAAFPLALAEGVAFGAIVMIALAGIALDKHLGMSMGDWLSNLFAIFFVGLLALLLSKVLEINLSTVRQAHLNEPNAASMPLLVPRAMSS